MRILIYLFIIFAIAFSLFTIARILLTFQLFDFVNVYYPAIQDILNGRNLYDNPATDVNYPPTTFLFLFPFGLIPIDIAQKIWTILSFSALIGSIFVILKAVTKKFSLFTFLFIYSFSVLSFPVKFTLGMGQINLLLLLLISLCFLFYQRKQFHIAGILLGIASGIKLIPLILLLFFLRKKAFGVVGAALITFVVLGTLGILLFGEGLTRQYLFEVLPNIPTSGNSVYYNQALTGFLARLAIPNEVASIINYLLLGILLLISFVVTNPKTKNISREFMEYGVFIIAILIGGGLAWQHHFVLLIIPYTTLLLSLFDGKEKRFSIHFIVLFISYILVAFNIKTPQAFSGVSAFLLSHVFYGTVILYGLSLKRLWLTK